MTARHPVRINVSLRAIFTDIYIFINGSKIARGEKPLIVGQRDVVGGRCREDAGNLFEPLDRVVDESGLSIGWVLCSCKPHDRHQDTVRVKLSILRCARAPHHQPRGGEEYHRQRHLSND